MEGYLNLNWKHYLPVPGPVWGYRLVVSGNTPVCGSPRQGQGVTPDKTGYHPGQDRRYSLDRTWGTITQTGLGYLHPGHGDHCVMKGMSLAVQEDCLVLSVS